MARLGDESLFYNAHKNYPWDTWLDGQVWVLKRGEDFTSVRDALRAAISTEAGRRGLKYRTSFVGTDEVAVQALGPRQAPRE